MGPLRHPQAGAPHHAVQVRGEPRPGRAPRAFARAFSNAAAGDRARPAPTSRGSDPERRVARLHRDPSRSRGSDTPAFPPALHPRGPRSSRPASIRPRRADPDLSHLPPPFPSRQAHAELRPARAHRRRQQGQRAVSRRGRTARETRARAIAPARVSRREERRESDGDGRVAKGSARENARAERGEREHTHLAVPREGPRRASRASSRSERGDMSPSTAPAALVGTTHH
jgi:hypothetical protein